MKINLLLSIITLFIIYSCNEVQRKNSGSWEYVREPKDERNINGGENKPPETIDLTEEKKEIAKKESFIRTDFNLNFKSVFEDGVYGYKIQVPISVKKINLISALEDFEISADRILAKIGDTPIDLKYKGELEIKVKAIKYFLENHDRDQTLFVKPPVDPTPKPEDPTTETPPEETGYCANLAGNYWEVGKEYKGERIEILKVDCTNFKYKENGQSHTYNISFYKDFKCKSMGSYALCTRAIKIDNNLINLLIKETWHNTGCTLNKNITIDLGRGILNSGITYRCSDSTKNYSKLIEFQLSPE